MMLQAFFFFLLIRPLEALHKLERPLELCADRVCTGAIWSKAIDALLFQAAIKALSKIVHQWLMYNPIFSET